MASKDRIQRLKEETRVNILEASLKIVKQEGWPALSMRKIADEIEYTAPMIYEYFANKEAILQELTRQGYLLLAKKMKEAADKYTEPAEKLENMWLAYWHFAFDEKELYQVMFGVDVNCCELAERMPESEKPALMVSEVIEELIAPREALEEEVCTIYYTFWSVIHGLISINILRRVTSEEINRQVLKTAITGIIRSIKT